MRNGAGKPTTMRMILGLDAPTSATALMNGCPYQMLLNPLREVGPARPPAGPIQSDRQDRPPGVQLPSA